MKKTQRLDLLRNIIRNKVSYISIIVIALLGVSIFLGLDYSAAVLRENGSDYFSAQHFRDVEAVSTLLFSQEDLEDMRGVEGVEDVEPVWQISARLSSGGDSRETNAISLTERLNLTQLAEGRLPETETECALEQGLAEEMGLTVGSEILLQDESGERPQYLRGERFTVTGIANHPDHSNTMVGDTCYVLLPPAAFDTDALDGCFMKAELAIEKDGLTDRYDDAYTTAVASVQERLEELALSRAARRDAEVREQARSEIDEGRRALDDALAELSAARAELDEGWAELDEGERELADAQTRLEEAQQTLRDTEAQLADARAQLDAAEEELADGDRQLRNAQDLLYDARAELRSGWEQLEDAKAQIRDGMRSAVTGVVGDAVDRIAWAGRQSVDVDAGPATAMTFWITTGYSCDLNRTLEENINDFFYSDQISDETLREAYVSGTGTEEGFNASAIRALLAASAVEAARSYEEEYTSLQSGCRAWDEGDGQYWKGLSEYFIRRSEYREGLAAYEEGLAEYEDGLAQYEDGCAAYEQGLAELEGGRQRLEDGRKRLEDGEADYADGLAAGGDAARQLDDAVRQLESLAPCRWLILDMNGNAGYVQLRMAGENLESLESTFALLFVLVGALVIFATVSKMVDEQRTQVGTTKALGFFNREIFAKYLSFGMSAAVLGAVLGVLTARFVMERIVLKGYNIYYTFSLMRPGITVLPTAVVLLSAAGLAVIAVWAACTRLLRTPAIRLLQPKIPTGAKKARKSGRSSLSLYSRLILLNLRTDIKRVLVTVVSVAGCCALIVVGMTLKTAMTGSLDRQYADIEDYDWRVTFSPGESETAREEIETLLREAGTEYAPLAIVNVTYRFGDIQTAELFCGDAEEIGKLYHLRDWQTGEPLSDTDEGILIQRRVAEYFGLGPGSEFEIALGGSKTATVSVAGVFDHYIGRPMVMSPAYYEQAFGESCEPDAFFVRLNGADEAALMEALRAVRGFAGVTTAESGRAVFDASTGVIDSLVALFIFMAAVMAGVVLMNLTNIYVMQKKRELTIMRVNGFTVKEVVGYMLRETVITTALGILIGMAVGSGIGYKICRSMEQPFLQIVRDPSVLSWIVGAALTLLFAALVNEIALRPVRKLKLTDVS